MKLFLVAIAVFAFSALADVSGSVPPVSVVGVGATGSVIGFTTEGPTTLVRVSIPVEIERESECAVYLGQKTVQNDLGQHLLVPHGHLRDANCDASSGPIRIDAEFSVNLRAVQPKLIPSEPVHNYTVEIEGMGTYLVSIAYFRDVAIQKQ